MTRAVVKHTGTEPNPAEGYQVVLRQLEYASLPLETHPIDTVQQQQGWGPFQGPWTPVDFQSADVAMTGGHGLDITWEQGDNRSVVDYAPPMAVITVMQDRSLDLVNNAGFQALIAQANAQPTRTSTFGQASQTPFTGVSPTVQKAAAQGSSNVVGKLRSLLGV